MNLLRVPKGRATRWPGRARILPVRAAAALAAAAVGASADGIASAAPPSSDYRLIFADEFNGTTLDAQKWNYNYTWGNQHNHRAYMDPSQVKIGGGALNLQAIAQRHPSATDGQADGAWQVRNYTSGAINSSGKLNLTNGYIEARIKMSDVVGSWPAFWTLQNGWPPEIDIMEFPRSGSNSASQYWANYHYTNASNAHASYGWQMSTPNLTTSYHDFAVEWTPTAMRFYFDGALRQTVTDAAAIADSANMYLILNHAVGGWAGEPAPNSSFPANYEVEWVRAWQKLPTAGAATSTWNVNGSAGWDAAASWNGAVPKYGDHAVKFGRVGAAAAATVDWGNSRTVGSIEFSGDATGTTAYTVGVNGSGLQLASTAGGAVGIGAVSSSTANQTVAARVELYNNATLYNDMTGGQTLGITGNVVGAGRLIAEGVGAVVLSGANNTYTGGTTIDAGGQGPAVLRANANGALGTGGVIIGEAGNGTSARLEVTGGRVLNNNIDFRGRNNSTVGIQSLSGNNKLAGTITLNLGGGSYAIQSDAGTLMLTGSAPGATATNVAIQAGSGDRTVTLQGAGNGEISGVVRDGGGKVSVAKAGAGTWTLSAANTYTGATTISGGTLKLAAPATIAPVGAYSFDNVTDAVGNPVSSGILGTNYVVPNGGSGGTAINGKANHANNSGGNSGATLVAGRFGNGLRLNGLGSSIDIPSKIVDQGGSGSWSMSAWIKTATPGSAFVSKNQGGTGWGSGFSVFYLGQNPIGSVQGPYPTAVRWGGGFVQGNAPVADNGWHLLTYVSDAGLKTVYVDGVAQAINMADFINPDTATFTRLGFNIDNAGGDGARHFNGDLDEIKFFNDALTAKQVQDLFAGNAILNPAAGPILPASTVVSITASGAKLDLNGNSQAIASLSGVAGSLITLGSGTLTTGSNNASTSFAGSISGSGGVTKVGTGTLTLGGANSYTGATTASGGKVLLNASITTSSALNATGGTIELAAGGSKLVKTSGVTINSGGKLDLQDNKLIVSGGALGAAVNGDYGGITGMIQDGRTGGTWTGSGIMTSQADADTGLTGLAVAAATAGQVVDGQTLNAGDVIVMYTLVGDADLNRRIDGDDYFRIDSNLGSTTPSYAKGDFDYNGRIDGDDYFLIDRNIGRQSLATFPAGAGAEVAAGGLAEGASAVPEPASMALLLASAAGTLRRRRRRATASVRTPSLSQRNSPR
ncbi:MAG TPA: family 16 glycosylhydrolase [Tepidisphaeraceae bacterium]|nr:family 16 glycosylhydrolase [Tepidisphaeraceae bacterium]